MLRANIERKILSVSVGRDRRREKHAVHAAMDSTRAVRRIKSNAYSIVASQLLRCLPLPMSSPSLPPLLDETLRSVARRYRLPPLTAPSGAGLRGDPASALALAIEQAREALASGSVPDPQVKRHFIEALARMIRDAMRDGEAGDPVFQAMELRHRVAHVREYASLAAHADQDRRQVRMAVNRVAHPARQQRVPAGPQRAALAQLHASAASASWQDVRAAALCLLAMPLVDGDAPAGSHRLAQLRDDPALARLERLDALAEDALVRRYQCLWDRNGPRSGSPRAVAQGVAAQRRGAAVEALAAQALQALAQRLNQTEAPRASYRVVTSMRVPASIPGSPDRAKTEWDAVLLGRAAAAEPAGAWDVCLLVEAKASVEAATTDLPRLLRGLHLLAQADVGEVYAFATRQGTVHLRGASLGALPTGPAGLEHAVLYCCDAPCEAPARLLGAASRMQLLSDPASLAYAGALAAGQQADPQGLVAVWDHLLDSPRWRTVQIGRAHV